MFGFYGFTGVLGCCLYVFALLRRDCLGFVYDVCSKPVCGGLLSLLLFVLITYYVRGYAFGG